ncbi:MAG: hypothetical protein NTY17_11355 [Planctomycetia bacterium]|nr:hypothetical protein [Planctomycetia bacterium]
MPRFASPPAAALSALGTLDDANGSDARRSLLTSASAETRYGGFQRLWKIDPTSSLVRGERLGDACSLHVLDVKGPPLVHVSRSRRPEIVLFGTEHPVGDGLRAEAGPTIVVVVDGPTAIISRFVAGDPDQQSEVPARVDTIIRAIAELGGTYPDIVQFLQQGSSHHAITSRLVFDALAEEDVSMSVHEEASARIRDIPSASTDEDAPAGDGAADAAPPTDESS